MKGPMIAVVAVIAVILLIVVGTIIWMVASYNGLVTMEENVDASWAQVENQYQRKFDLIPQLVAAVEDYQEFENSTLTEITALRTQWQNADTQEEQIDTANQLDTALRSIILTYESYPYLQSVVVVRDLMIELEGTENRITVERMRYNEDVRDFNKEIKKFPKVIIANMFGYSKAELFEIEDASVREVPEVKF